MSEEHKASAAGAQSKPGGDQSKSRPSKGRGYQANRRYDRDRRDNRQKAPGSQLQDEKASCDRKYESATGEASKNTSPRKDVERGNRKDTYNRDSEDNRRQSEKGDIGQSQARHDSQRGDRGPRREGASSRGSGRDSYTR